MYRIQFKYAHAIMFCVFCRSVKVSKFLANNTQILSCSDDNTVKIWDVPSEQQVVSYTDHKVSL